MGAGGSRTAGRGREAIRTNFPDGIRDVIVNGTPEIDGGVLTAVLPGRFLERPAGASH
jgi:hypothetical protein